MSGGWTLSISPCWPLHTYPHRVVKGPHFEVWTRPEPEIISPNTAQDRHLFLKPDLGLKAKLTEGVDIGVGAGKILGVRMIFARILTNFPENWAPVFSNQKMLGAIFAHTFTEFVKVFRDFALMLKDFHQIKPFGGVLTLPAPPPPTPVS